MPSFRRSFLIPAVLAGSLSATQVDANGINPPQKYGAATMEARCTDRQSGKVATVHRARTGLDPADAQLVVRLDKAADQTLQLSQVGRLLIATGKPDREGFAKASLELLQPGYKGEGLVQLKVKGKPVRLTGFGSDRERIDMALANCKELVLKTASPSEPPGGSPAKKP